MYQVNNEKWDALIYGKTAAIVARTVWPLLAEPGAKLSKIVNGKARLVGSEPNRLADALGCNMDELIEVFPYLKDGK